MIQEPTVENAVEGLKLIEIVIITAGHTLAAHNELR